MKKVYVVALALCLSAGFTACREKTEKEKAIEEMNDEGADINVKDGGDKIKMETDDKEVKIKTDDDGNTKIKTDDNS